MNYIFINRPHNIVVVNNKYYTMIQINVIDSLSKFTRYDWTTRCIVSKYGS